MAPVGSEKVRCVNPGAGLSSPIVPSACRKYTAETKSQIAPSWVPAFMASAPPSVAGIPTRHSIPPSPIAAASRIIVERVAPQPMVTSSPWDSIRPRQPSILRPMPRKPRSRTSVLCPLPSRATGSFSLSANISVFRTSSTSWGMMKMSAGPPQRSDVWNASGSLKRTSPRISPSMPVSFSARNAVARCGLARPQALAHLVRDRTDVAGSEGQDQVARPDGEEEDLHHVGPVTHVSDIPTAAPLDPLDQPSGVNSWDRRLTRRIDVGHDQNVGVVERCQELVVQVKCPRVAVGLEGDDAPAGEALARRGQGRPDLRRVMAVVVHQQDPRHLALDLKAPLDAGEGGTRALDDRERDLEIQGDRRRRQSVRHVVDARDLEAELAERVSLVEHLEACGQLAQAHRGGDEVGGRAEAIGDHALLRAR